MRDEEYCEVMLEAYRDVLSHVLSGATVLEIHNYLKEQIEFHVKWGNEA